VLSRERYPNNGYKKQRSKNEVNESCIKSSTNQPDYIKQDGKTAVRLLFWHYFFSEGPDYERSNLETLKTPWNPDYGEAEYKSAENISERCQEASKYEPDKVSKEIHDMKISDW
jgi:hypothetical protein